MTSIAALPAPAAVSGPTSLARAKALLMSDALPVQPIKAIPGEAPRRPYDEIAASGDAVESASFGGTDAVGARARRPDGKDREPPAGRTEDGPVTARPSGLAAPGPTPGYVTQSIHQEALGSGLHIEPWTAAIDAYRRADRGPGAPQHRSVTV